MNDILDFYGAAFDMVKAWPRGERDWQRINSFVVLEKMDDLENDSFGKGHQHYYTKTFFDRRFVANKLKDKPTITFPCLAMYEYEFRGEHARAGRSGGSSQKMTHRLEVYLLAKMPQKLAVGETYDRNVHYTFSEMSSYIKLCIATVYHQLSRLIRVSNVVPSGALNEGWHSSDRVNTMMSSGLIASYDEVKTFGPHSPSNYDGAVLPYMLSRALMGGRSTMEIQTDPCVIPFTQGFEYDTDNGIG